mmetsp:Transcript_3093/g.4737  ORF Transcript_3093/g.4737 Transcript_3093/m.4737 type:complete len:627 (-) Transcript_3093:275-2155(-)
MTSGAVGMIEVPAMEWLFPLAAVVVACLGFLGRSVWTHSCPRDEMVAKYLKHYEYGESDDLLTSEPRQNKWWRSWTPYAQPLNAWSSLAYSFIGIVVLGVSYVDMSSDGEPRNEMAKYPSFGILYGLTNIWLGIASGLFHASLRDYWRAVDAGMTNGVIMAPLFFELFLMIQHSEIGEYWFTALALLLQMSFMYGYMPYGSSDIVLPALVATTWTLGFYSRYSEPLPEMWKLFKQCQWGLFSGFLLRLYDIKRKVPRFLTVLIGVYYGMNLFYFWWSGYQIIYFVPALYGGVVMIFPWVGHSWWHFSTAYALLLWYVLNRSTPDFVWKKPPVADKLGFLFLICIASVNAVRRLCLKQIPLILRSFYNASYPSPIAMVSKDSADASSEQEQGEAVTESKGKPSKDKELKEFENMSFKIHTRIFILLSHCFTVLYGYKIVVSSVWYKDVYQCYDEDAEVTADLQLYYFVSGAFHFEAWIYQAYKLLQGEKPDFKMLVHHAVTNVLIFFSYGTSSVTPKRIGSLVLWLHDVSDLPLATLRLFLAANYDIGVKATYPLVLLMWAYWRLWFFASAVLYSILTVTDVSQLLESVRYPFFFLLGTLWVLHCIWFGLLVRKGLESRKKEGKKQG